MKGEGIEPAVTRVRVTSAILFVSRLDRSTEFYRDVLSCTATIREPGAALLLAPDGFQIYLIARGTNAEHPSGGIGPQYLVWAVDSDAELQDIEQALQHRVGRTDRNTSGGVTFLAAHDPDGIRILVAHPSPEQLPRSVIGAHLYV
jgi:catechol 2,3-dioxygenase-like lactoylglutathione lyase family enzyme